MARFLLDDETLVVAQRQHWAAVAQPAALAIAGLFLTIVAGLTAPPKLGILTDLAWKLWFILLVYAAIHVLMWRLDWFVATDKRLLMTYGLLKRRVAMMPLAKVTDMSFNRSLLGQVFGYGQFVLESAGREQALRRMDFIRDAKGTYLAIVGEIFGEAVDEPERLDEEPDDDITDPFLHLQLAGARTDSSDSTDIPVRPLGSYGPMSERPRGSSLRDRFRRRRTDDPPPAFGHEDDVGWPAPEAQRPARKPRDLSDD